MSDCESAVGISAFNARCSLNQVYMQVGGVWVQRNSSKCAQGVRPVCRSGHKGRVLHCAVIPGGHAILEAFH